MMGHGGGTADGYLNIQRALDIARNSEGVVDPTIASFLERALRDLWGRITAQPSTYLMNKDEFALFNYFRTRFTQSPTAQDAIQRFWNNYYGDPRAYQTGG
jgi:hypothetical protein